MVCCQTRKLTQIYFFSTLDNWPAPQTLEDAYVDDDDDGFIGQLVRHHD